jgi:hypothetical protein
MLAAVRVAIVLVDRVPSVDSAAVLGLGMDVVVQQVAAAATPVGRLAMNVHRLVVVDPTT